MTGLTSEKVKCLQAQYGPNQLPEPEGEHVLLIFVHQFLSPFIYMLFAAAVVSFALGQSVNGIFIFIVLLLNASIGTVQEYSAQQAAIALKKMVPQNAVVIRDGVSQKIDAKELVPGDRVQLVSGDRVPADIELNHSQGLLVDESILTGESLAAGKQVTTSANDEAPLVENENKVFAGTIVSHGRSQGTVIGIGANTKIGQIAVGVGERETQKPPLLQRIESFTLHVTYAVLVVIALLFVISILRGADLEQVFLLGVALAVSAIPEGLPAAITVALAIGMRRMAKVNVIVRKLIAVESLGSCTCIASDKTGTLTVNEMTIKKVVLPSGRQFGVAGEGLDIHGEIQAFESNDVDSGDLENLVRAGLLANESSLTFQGGDRLASGDGVDLAFLVLAAKYGFDLQQAQSIYPEQGIIPYESEQAFSASVNLVSGLPHLSVKGSAEKVLPMCSGVNVEELLKDVSNLASQGYRVLTLADRALNSSGMDPAEQLNDLRFLGFVAMIDPLRPEAIGAVAECHKARIDVIMVTGDHPQTALALAEQLGICQRGDRAVTGAELHAALNRPETLKQLICENRVFSRVAPEQKTLIVEQLIDAGHYVAVTGDGVNDAPALHHAHVGIAMGKRGSDVARESSKLIITDDNFASIVEGIKQGRVVYNNIRKVVFLLISTGAAEITLFILSVLFGVPIPLFPIQLLWLNLVTNGIQDVALAFEPPEGNELKQSPRPPGESIFNRLMLERVAINAAVMGSLAFIVFYWNLSVGVEETVARNTTLLLMVLFENVHVLNSRSETQSMFRQPFFGNPLLLFGMLTAQGLHIGAMYTPGLSGVLMVQPVSLEQWGSLLLVATSLIVVDELHKWRRS